ncbi:MAG: hypothetical protein ACRCTR_08105 [Actinomycetota bacterium]
MSEVPAFRVVFRGYEPTEVEATIQDLNRQLSQTRQGASRADILQRHVDQLTTRIGELEAEARRREEEGPARPDFDQLGARVTQILKLAQTEADDIRGAGKTETDQLRQKAANDLDALRAEATKLSEAQRAEATQEAQRIKEEAQQRATEIAEEAERAAETRRNEAEALQEGQRAQAAKAAAEFETALASRRERSEREFMERRMQAETEYETLQQHTEELRQEAERYQREGTAQINAELDKAKHQAAEIVAQAQAKAARLRAESQRELTVAAQRRDSINAQLANVRQMLATLAGAAPALEALSDESLAQAVTAAPDTQPVAAAAPVTPTAGGMQKAAEIIPTAQDATATKASPATAPVTLVIDMAKSVDEDTDPVAPLPAGQSSGDGTHQNAAASSESDKTEKINQSARVRAAAKALREEAAQKTSQTPRRR